MRVHGCYSNGIQNYLWTEKTKDGSFTWHDCCWRKSYREIAARVQRWRNFDFWEAENHFKLTLGRCHGNQRCRRLTSIFLWSGQEYFLVCKVSEKSIFSSGQIFIKMFDIYRNSLLAPERLKLKPNRAHFLHSNKKVLSVVISAIVSLFTGPETRLTEAWLQMNWRMLNMQEKSRPLAEVSFHFSLGER